MKSLKDILNESLLNEGIENQDIEIIDNTLKNGD